MPRSKHNCRNAGFEVGRGGLHAGGDGWIFSAMFVQCIAGAADGTAATDEDRYKEKVMRAVDHNKIVIY